VLPYVVVAEKGARTELVTSVSLVKNFGHSISRVLLDFGVR
jgi:hypothetical protein